MCIVSGVHCIWCVLYLVCYCIWCVFYLAFIVSGVYFNRCVLYLVCIVSGVYWILCVLYVLKARDQNKGNLLIYANLNNHEHTINYTDSYNIAIPPPHT